MLLTRFCHRIDLMALLFVSAVVIGQESCRGKFYISDHLPLTIRSPNYPARYPARSRCQWTIAPMYNTSSVSITCTDIDTAGMRLGVPVGDYLRVTSGAQRRRLAMNLDFTHCRNVPFHVEGKSGEEVRLDFVSDGIIQRRGFTCQAMVLTKRSSTLGQCGKVPVRVDQSTTTASGSSDDTSATAELSTSRPTNSPPGAPPEAPPGAPPEAPPGAPPGATGTAEATTAPPSAISAKPPQSTSAMSQSQAETTESLRDSIYSTESSQTVDKLEFDKQQPATAATTAALATVSTDKMAEDDQKSNNKPIANQTVVDYSTNDADLSDKVTEIHNNIPIAHHIDDKMNISNEDQVSVTRLQNCSILSQKPTKQSSKQESLPDISTANDQFVQKVILLPPPSLQALEAWEASSLDTFTIEESADSLDSGSGASSLQEDTEDVSEDNAFLARQIQKSAFETLENVIKNKAAIESAISHESGTEYSATDRYSESHTTTPSRQSKVQTKVVNGREAEPHAYPWAVFLRITANGNPGVVCGGSLISQNFVLTAAHCVEQADSVAIMVGYHDLDRPSAYSRQISAKEKIVHPAWRIQTVEHDIALLQLQETLQFNEHVQPICLPSRSQIGETFAGLTGTMLGWGGHGAQFELSRVLRVASERILSNCQCQWRWLYVVTPLKMCVSGGGSRSPCGGDSGGILQVTSESGHAVQVGVVSWGSQLGCDSRWPSGYTRVTGYLDWIEENSDVTIAQ